MNVNTRMLSLPGDFKTALIWSVAAHVVFALLLTIRAVFFSGAPLRIENSIRVDIVGLPDKVRALPEEPAEPAPASPKQEPETTKSVELEAAKKALPTKPEEAPTAVILKPKKSDPKESRKNQEAALKRLDALARLERQAKADAAAKAIAAAGSRAGTASAHQIKGNEVSRGNSLTGLTRLDHDRYLDDIEIRIRKMWNPPKFLAKSGLRVRVVLFINSQGLITQHKIVQSSGNSVFDDSADAALESAQPFAPPPDSLESLLAQQGVELDLEPAGYR